MVYASKTFFKQVSFIKRALNKLGKSLAQHFPYNVIRVIGLRICGYEVGEKVYIGQDLIVASIISENSCHLRIGNRVAIGPRVTILLSSDANWSRLTEIIPSIKSTVVLEDDSWIGAGVIIMPGITIGKFSIIGSGAVVTKNVDPFTVVAGVPAKLIKKLNENFI